MTRVCTDDARWVTGGDRGTMRSPDTLQPVQSAAIITRSGHSAQHGKHILSGILKFLFGEFIFKWVNRGK